MTQPIKNLPAMQETQEMWVQVLDWQDPLEEEMATTLVFLPGKSHGQRSLVGCSSKGLKASDMTEHTRPKTSKYPVTVMSKVPC